MFCASNPVGIVVGIGHWNYVAKPFGFCYLVAVRKTVSVKMSHLLWAPVICVRTGVCRSSIPNTGAEH